MLTRITRLTMMLTLGLVILCTSVVDAGYEPLNLVVDAGSNVHASFNLISDQSCNAYVTLTPSSSIKDYIDVQDSTYLKPQEVKKIFVDIYSPSGRVVEGYIVAIQTCNEEGEIISRTVDYIPVRIEFKSSKPTAKPTPSVHAKPRGGGGSVFPSTPQTPLPNTPPPLKIFFKDGIQYKTVTTTPTPTPIPVEFKVSNFSESQPSQPSQPSQDYLIFIYVIIIVVGLFSSTILVATKPLRPKIDKEETEEEMEEER